MRTYVLLTITLLVGVVAGGTGVWALCEQGYCGERATDTVGQGPASAIATGTAATFGAGPNGAESANPVPTAFLPDPTLPARPTVQPIPTSGTLPVIAPLTGLAIIGDSTADEYRADNPRGGDYGNTTFNWVELLVRERAINVGSWGERPEPRRSGYEFNWARSGATSESMLSAGQHSGVAQQVGAGQVSHVIIQIGVNDFYYNDVALAVYDGRLSGEPLQLFLDGIVSNVQQAVQAVKSAGENRVILSATQDLLSAGILPGMREVFPDATGWQRLVDAFAYVNHGLREVAAREAVTFFDFNAALQAELEPRFGPTGREYLVVGGEQIDITTKGNDPLHLFIDDEFAHFGTVFSGLIANLYVAEMNAVFGTAFEPFSDDEILRIAGVR